MINSLLMLGGSSNKKISKVFIVTWLAYMVFGSNLSLGLTFPIINGITFLAITLLISKIKNNKANTALSDIICYYLYPTMSSNITLINYIFNGILFNYKYIFSNILVLSLIKVVSISKNILTEKLSTKECKIYEV